MTISEKDMKNVTVCIKCLINVITKLNKKDSKKQLNDFVYQQQCRIYKYIYVVITLLIQSLL